MRARNSYRTILGLCFVLLFGVAIAQQSQKYADAKYIAAGPPGWRVTGDDTLGGFSLNEGIAQPGTAGPVPHRHSREDELWYVLEGQLEFKIGERGEQIIVAGPGATVFGPRGIPHTFRAVGTTPARYLTFISPAGFEKFFAERIALGKEVPTTDPSYAARYKVLTDKYGVEYSSDWSFPPMAKN
jgi:mannose-6-phosphate isomerase-like protein (cupin superfamily)